MHKVYADAAGGAAPVASDDALAGEAAQGTKDSFEGGTEGIVQASDPGSKPVSPDADLPVFLALKTAAARDGWQLTRIVAAGAAVYFVARLTFRQDFHELGELRAFLASRGVRS